LPLALEAVSKCDRESGFGFAFAVFGMIPENS